jgi:integrase/recombinase XerD
MFSINETGNAIVYRTTINRFMNFVNDVKLRFDAIDYSLLESFRRHLLKDGVKQNTISNYFRTLRAIYNKAIKAKVVDRARYPFMDINVKTERTPKRAISVDDLVKIARCELKPKSRQWRARNYFMLSFALTGASFTDLAYLTSNNIKKGRLVYKRRKTGKELSIKLQPYTDKLFAHYEGMNAKYLLPALPSGVVENSMTAKSFTQNAQICQKSSNKLGNCLFKAAPYISFLVLFSYVRQSNLLRGRKAGLSDEHSILVVLDPKRYHL